MNKLRAVKNEQIKLAKKDRVEVLINRLKVEQPDMYRHFVALLKLILAKK